jgi:hypothetical protein
MGGQGRRASQRVRLTPAHRRSLVSSAAWVGLVGTGLFGAFAVAHYNGVPPQVLWDDPAALAGYPWYMAIVHVAGIGLWAVAGTAALIAASFAPTRADRFAFMALGTFSFVFMIDDQIMLHEELLPGLGLSELMVYGIYAVALLTIGLKHGRVFLRSADAPTLILAVCLLGVSVALDVTKPLMPARQTLEEGAKALGLVALAMFSVRTAIALGRGSPDVDLAQGRHPLRKK